jgi:uncharacterized membrane protein
MIVGWSLSDDGNDHAVIWYNGGILDLNSLVNLGSEWDYLASAQAINDLGEIVGYGYINGELHAFKASPVPVPAAVWLFGSGLLGIIGIGRKRYYKEV